MRIFLRNRNNMNKQLKTTVMKEDLEKEMLYSFLQKNTSKNLSSLKFEFKDGIWLISGHNFQQKCVSFNEVSDLIANIG